MSKGLGTEGALLGLLNSTPVVEGERRDLLDVNELDRLLQGFDVSTPPSSLSAMRAVRALLQHLVVGDGDLSAAQRWLDPIAQVPRLTGTGVVWELHGPAEAIAPARAVLEWARLEREAPGRLRACANTECAKFLLDRSRAGTGRWCSMAECGNRMKARRHAQRAAEDVARPGSRDGR